MSYAVNECFLSLQGEGMRAGEASVFVRFAGCNQTCLAETHEFDCDTEFVSSIKMSLAELVGVVQELAGACRWVVLTGGEPGLQVDHELIDTFHAQGFKLAVETNGSIALPEGLDWITVSPKVAEHAVRQLTATEVKYVRGHGQGIPKPACDAKHKLLSPAARGLEIDQKALEWCAKLCVEHPEWRLSVQMHKWWRLR